MIGDAGYSVVSPPERHISVTSHEIVEVFRGRMGSADRLKFQDFCKLVEATAQFEYLDVRRRIKRNFRLFSLGAKGEEFTARLGRNLPRKTEIVEREIRFISDFVELMKTAHYQILTEKEWDMATAEEFQLTMPVAVNWKFLDNKMLTRFWNEKPAYSEGLAPLSDKILVFHRGVGVTKLKGLFVSEKIDLLVKYLIVDPVWSLGRYLIGRGVGEKKNVATDGNNEARTEGDGDGFRHKNVSVVQRRTLRRALPTPKDVIKKFHRQVEIQEPRFKDIVVLYRKAKHKPMDMVNPSKATLSLAKRNIFIKLFEDIPMADLELIFPEKRVFITPLTLIQLGITVVIAIITAITTLMGTDLAMAVVLPALAIVLGRVAQVYSQLEQERAQMTTTMATMLYNKTRDSQEGAVFTLLDEMAEQHFKEAVMAYALLLLSKDPLDQATLDDECETFLEEHFGVKIDFAIEGSLPRLVTDGLVEVDERTGGLTPVDLDTAVEILTEKWHKCFANMGDLNENASFLRSSIIMGDGVGDLGRKTIGVMSSGLKGLRNKLMGMSKKVRNEEER
ncbi:hypothetical protein BSKO_01464 [Bryopsis sp. KO-2023]|nr:hypothetical protein BSKO_01464 [Bryopsis sp. KO-2023]